MVDTNKENTLLNEVEYAEAFLAFTETSNETEMMGEWFCHFVASHYQQASLKVLSVGSGAGIFDTTILPFLNQFAAKAVYHALDPNELLLQKLKLTSEGLNLTNTEISFFNMKLDDFAAQSQGNRYDIIHFIHSLYYFKNLEKVVQMASAMLKPGGTIIAALCALKGIYQIKNEFKNHLGLLSGWVFSDNEFSAILDREGYNYDKEVLDTRINVTSCLDVKDARGTAQLNFILDVDVNSISPQLRGKANSLIRKYGFLEGNELYLRQPVVIFSIKPKLANRAS